MTHGFLLTFLLTLLLTLFGNVSNKSVVFGGDLYVILAKREGVFAQGIEDFVGSLSGPLTDSQLQKYVGEFPTPWLAFPFIRVDKGSTLRRFYVA